MGYVVVGIADDAADAEKVTALDEVVPLLYRGFHVVGLEREAKIRGESVNDYWSWLIQRLRSSLPAPVALHVASGSQFVAYNDKAVIVLKSQGAAQPVFLDDKLYERSGSDTVLVSTQDYMRVFAPIQQLSTHKISRPSGRDEGYDHILYGPHAVDTKEVVGVNGHKRAQGHRSGTVRSQDAVIPYVYSGGGRSMGTSSFLCPKGPEWAQIGLYLANFGSPQKPRKSALQSQKPGVRRSATAGIAPRRSGVRVPLAPFLKVAAPGWVSRWRAVPPMAADRLAFGHRCLNACVCSTSPDENVVSGVRS